MTDSRKIPYELTDEQRAALLRGEPVEIIPAPGKGKRIVIDADGTHYRIEDVAPSVDPDV